MGDVALDVDVAIDDQGGVEVAGGQRQEVRLFALMTLQRRFLEVAQDAHVSNVLQPPGGHLVEMLQRVEGAAIEQAGLDIKELPLHFSLGLRPANLAGLRAEAIVGGEGQELGVVENAVGIVAEHDRLEIVVEADAGHAAKVMKGLDVVTQGCHQIHRFDKTQILPAGVAEQVAEQVDATTAFAGEVDVVDAIVHLGLFAWAVSKRCTGAGVDRGRKRRMRSRTTVYLPVKPRACNSCQARSTVSCG